jgi:hypothetical protein
VQIDGERVLDFHTHVFPQEIVQARERYSANEPWFESLYAPPKSRLATAADLARSMECDSISAAVALNFGWRDAGLCRETNDSIVEALRPYRQIIPFCAVAPGDSGAAREIERCAALGFRGVGELNADGQQFDITDERTMRPVIEACKAHNMVLLVHASEPVGHAYPGKGANTPAKLAQFLSMAQDLRVVLAHWGGGLVFYELMPEIAELARHAFYDTAATPYLYDSRVYRIGSQLIGSRLLFGSDYPLMPQSRALKHLDKAQLGAEERRSILWENGARLLGIP